MLGCIINQEAIGFIGCIIPEDIIVPVLLVQVSVAELCDFELELELELEFELELEDQLLPQELAVQSAVKVMSFAGIKPEVGNPDRLLKEYQFLFGVGVGMILSNIILTEEIEFQPFES